MSRTLIFDVFRLQAMIRLTDLGPDITCEYSIRLPVGSL